VSKDPIEERLRGVIIGEVEPQAVVVADYDPAWPERFRREEAKIRKALGGAALRVEHIGSTSVPGLASKPIVDVLLVVEDSGDEASYLPLRDDPDRPRAAQGGGPAARTVAGEPRRLAGAEP
jgi:GrpB-like predicted nucleotidyltransferase (UPF0157 family)